MSKQRLRHLLPCFLVLSLAGPVMAAAWIDEGFETYSDHRQFMEAWPVDGGHQDARVCEEQCAGRGTHSLMELPNEDSRHLRVFDATNSVNGTDECPLHLSYGVFLKDHMATSFRTCELINTETGDRIGIGPALHSTYLQVFDGTAWRDLAFAPERTAGWNSLDLTIKTDRLCVIVTNAKGRSYEEVPRATHASFGTLAIGSGRANGGAPSYVDGVILDGGTLTRAEWPHPGAAALGPAEMAYVFRANSAIQQLYSAAKGEKILAELEAMLDELEQSKGKVQAQAVLPWIYEAIATQKNMAERPAAELRAIHYEAITKAPDGIGADIAVRNLAQLLNEPERTHLLLNLCREMKDTIAARTAARMLLEPRPGEPAAASMDAKRDLVERGATPPLLPAGQSAPDPHAFLYLLENAKGVAEGGAILARCAEQLAGAGDTDALEALGRWAAGSGHAEYASVAREALCKARLAAGDLWGGLAAISDRPLGDERAALVRELAGAAEPAAVRQLLSELLVRAVKARLTIREQAGDAPRPPTPEARLWQAIAYEAERCGLTLAAMVAFQQLSRSGELIVAADGTRLDERFAPKAARPAEMVSFWKAQWLIAANHPWQAEPLLAELARTSDASLRGQVLFELARLRRSQHRPESASRPAADCETLLAHSPALRDLKAQIAVDLGRVQDRKQLYDALDAAWTQIRQTRDAAQAAAALISASQIESTLGSPERAAEALEVLVSKYPQAAALPAGLDRLARVYERDLKRLDKAQALRERLTREYPEYQPAQTRERD